MAFTFSELDATIVRTFGDSVTLRRNGLPDVLIVAVATDRDTEQDAPGLLREYFTTAGEAINDGDHLLINDVPYRIGPVTVETSGARRFKVYRRG